MLLLFLYCVVFKLRFRLEASTIFILCVQFVVMGARIFLREDQSIAQGVIIIVGDILFKIALYYFVFEMNYVALKLESTSIREYLASKRKVKIAKALVIGGMALIQMPIATISLVISTVEQF